MASTKREREAVRDVLAVGRMAESVDQLVEWLIAAVHGDDEQDDRCHYVVHQWIDGQLHGWGPYLSRTAAENAAKQLPEIIAGPVAGVHVIKPVPRGKR